MDKPIVLDGHSLTTAQIAAIARSDVPVELAPPAMERASEARKVVLELSNSKRPIYGLNTGLGANKDNRIEPEQYHRFNTCILHSHSVASPDFKSGCETGPDSVPAVWPFDRYGRSKS